MNQQGQRLRGFEVNTLTVIATESYEQFAENLQKEIEEETGIQFGIVEDHQFAAISVTDAEGELRPLGFEQSKVLWEHLKEQRYIDSKGKVQDSLKSALKTGTLVLPESFAGELEQITAVLKKTGRTPGNKKMLMSAVRYVPDRQYCIARSSENYGIESSIRRPIGWSSTMSIW